MTLLYINKFNRLISKFHKLPFSCNMWYKCSKLSAKSWIQYLNQTNKPQVDAISRSFWPIKHWWKKNWSFSRFNIFLIFIRLFVIDLVQIIKVSSSFNWLFFVRNEKIANFKTIVHLKVLCHWRYEKVNLLFVNFYGSNYTFVRK